MTFESVNHKYRERLRTFSVIKWTPALFRNGIGHIVGGCCFKTGEPNFEIKQFNMFSGDESFDKFGNTSVLKCKLRVSRLHPAVDYVDNMNKIVVYGGTDFQGNFQNSVEIISVGNSNSIILDLTHHQIAPDRFSIMVTDCNEFYLVA
jgi:hypothetical protein